MARITLKDVNNKLKGTGWSCLSKEYKNLKTPMQFKCPEGHLVEATWQKIRSEPRCPTCQANLKMQIVDVAPLKKTDKIRVLALDQSSFKTGWSIYDSTELIAYGIFETNKREQIDRITELCDWLNSMVVGWKPDLVGIEDIQYNPRGEFQEGTQNHNTFKLLGQVMGAIMISAIRLNCPIEVVNIKTWKGYCKVRGSRRADQKRSAQLLVKNWHDVTVTNDESDAICIGKYFAETIKTGSDKKEGIGDF